MYGPLFSSIYSPMGESWSPATPGVPGEPGYIGGFGWALSAGDFDNDGKDDVACGAPHFGGGEPNGTVTVLKGN